MVVYLDQLKLETTNFQEEIISQEGEEKRKISFDFKVTSEEYHDVTTKLYENNFIVSIPEKELKYPATILNYSTSITDLYVEGAVGDYKLELIEVNNR